MVPRWLSLVDVPGTPESIRLVSGKACHSLAPQGRGFKPRPRLHTASAEHTVYKAELRISHYADDA